MRPLALCALCVLALFGASCLVNGGRSRVQSGNLYVAGNPTYDAYFREVHALQGTGADESAWLRLRLRAPCSADLRRLICDIPGVLLVERDGESDGLSQWRVLTADAFTPERIARDLSRASVGVHEITTTASDLEQLFLRLTAAAAAPGGARA